MGEHSKIEWTDTTWNPIAGSTGVMRFDEKTLEAPLRWRNPRTIFVNSMSDLFHEDVPDDWIDMVFAVMASSPWHVFCVITKRPERMRSYFQGIEAEAPERLRHYIDVTMAPGRAARQALDPAFAEPDPPTPALRALYDRALPVMRAMGISPDTNNRDGVKIPQKHWRKWPLTNVWLGASVENQEAADKRIPALLEIPAAVHFLSCEPMLGPINLRDVAWIRPGGQTVIDSLTGRYVNAVSGTDPALASINWVICGGESGPNARPMHPDWARGLRDQCQEAEVPFFFKQWGQWAPSQALFASGVAPGDSRQPWGQCQPRMDSVGKRAAGRLLDGREWNELPVAAEATR